MAVFPDVDQAIEKEFTGNPLAIRALKDLFLFKKLQHQSNSDDRKWAEYRKKNWASLYCAKFMMGPDSAALARFERIRKIFLSRPEMKDFDALEFKKLLENRDLRRLTFKEFENVREEEMGRFCPFQIPEELSRKRKAEFTEGRKKMSAASIGPDDLDKMHPTLRKMILEAKNRANGNTEKASALMVMFLMPTLEMKANMEFIPQREKKCPGIVEKTWTRCKEDKRYPALFPGTSKMLCFQDHEAEIPQHCR